MKSEPCRNVFFEVEKPMRGGLKQSRVGGDEALRFFTSPKNVCIAKWTLGGHSLHRDNRCELSRVAAEPRLGRRRAPTIDSRMVAPAAIIVCCFISDVVLDEAGEGDAEQVALRLRTLEGIPKLARTAEGEHLANAQLLDRLEPIAATAGFKLPRVCTPEELMGVSAYE
jgi:hypothetical protein